LTQYQRRNAAKAVAKAQADTGVRALQVLAVCALGAACLQAAIALLH
jgi:hypothetical protein